MKNKDFLKNLIIKFSGFSFVGIVVTLLSIILLFIFNDLCNFNPYCSYVLAYLLTLFLSYFLNAKYVFCSPLKLTGVILYFMAYFSGMLLGIFLIKIFSLAMPEASKTLLSVAAIPFTMIWNYFLADRIMNLCKHKQEDLI